MPHKRLENGKMDEIKDTPENNTHDNAEAISQFLGTPSEILARYTHCAFCGAHLHLTHITDFSKNLTEETARCPECGVRARRLIHRLQ